jgi:hypothetical protein
MPLGVAARDGDVRAAVCTSLHSSRPGQRSSYSKFMRISVFLQLFVRKETRPENKIVGSTVL